MDDERHVYYKITSLGQNALAAELERYREVVAVAEKETIHLELIGLWHLNLSYDDAEIGTERCFASTRSRTRERFGEGMEQTSSDLLRERAARRGDYLVSLSGCFVETSAGVFRENVEFSHYAFNKNYSRFARRGGSFDRALDRVGFCRRMELGRGRLRFRLGNLCERRSWVYVRGKYGGHHRVQSHSRRCVRDRVHPVLDKCGRWHHRSGPVNLMYLGVFAVGFVGAVIARFQ